MSATLSGVFDDYWNRTETYEALKVYIDMNFDGVRDAIIAMMAGDRVRINTRSFQNDMTTFNVADDVMTLLVHLGYLGYDFDTKAAFVPNQEVLSEFVTAMTVSGWPAVVDSIQESSAPVLADMPATAWASSDAHTASGRELWYAVTGASTVMERVEGIDYAADLDRGAGFPGHARAWRVSR